MHAVLEESYYLNCDALRVKGDALSNARTTWINQDTPYKPGSSEA